MGNSGLQNQVVLDPGTAQKLQFAVNRNGGSKGDVDWLSSGDNFELVLHLARGCARVEFDPLVVECDLDPREVAGLTLRRHERRGSLVLKRVGDHLYVNDRKMELFQVAGRQWGGKTITIGELLTVLRREKDPADILNACILDALEAYPYLIPFCMKKYLEKYPPNIYFGGSTYHGHQCDAYVRGFYRHREGCGWGTCVKSLDVVASGWDYFAVLGRD
jgi:hypothetical protein